MATTPTQLAEALRKAGCGWILSDPTKDDLLLHRSRLIDDFVAAYRQVLAAVGLATPIELPYHFHTKGEMLAGATLIAFRPPAPIPDGAVKS